MKKIMKNKLTAYDYALLLLIENYVFEHYSYDKIEQIIIDYMDIPEIDKITEKKKLKNLYFEFYRNVKFDGWEGFNE